MTRMLLKSTYRAPARAFHRAVVNVVARGLRYSPVVQRSLLEAIAKAQLESNGRLLFDVLKSVDEEFAERQHCFSQEGEDLVLARLVQGVPPAYYVDIGAHHPFRFSNTALLHKAGWKGINIDATPGTAAAFRKLRPNDVNLELFIGDGGETKYLHTFNEPALNTASEKVLNDRKLANTPYREMAVLEVQPTPLRSVLDQYLPSDATIGVMSVDVEGAEMGVLRSNDWTKYRPSILLVEQLATDLRQCLDHETTRFLAQWGYDPIAKAYNTTFFELTATGSAAK